VRSTRWPINRPGGVHTLLEQVFPQIRPVLAESVRL